MSFHLDHVIILLPYASLIDLPTWITANFTITPGGTHADGRTENKLVCFQDGSYIEFISFINDDPKNREGHWWGTKKFGIIDFAFTNGPDGDALTMFSELERRLAGLQLGAEFPVVEYQAPVTGGRRRPDGQEVKWNVTFPVVSTGYQRGELPFFCHDLTPREVRVPQSEANTTHPNGAYGMDEMYIYVSPERSTGLSQALSAVLGVHNSASETDPDFVGQFETKRLSEVKGAVDPVLVVGSPMDEEQLAAMEERGGLLLGGLTLGRVDATGSSSNTLLRRIDVEDGGLGGITAPAF